MKTQAEPRALDLSEKFNHLWHLVGNTPMLEIFYTLEGISRSIFVKCEHYNLTGSIKDRMALYISIRRIVRGKSTHRIPSSKQLRAIPVLPFLPWGKPWAIPFGSSCQTG
ncbi:hypothetical protein [Siphonobacter sp. SORGH_AS_0500]|uniref:hypothetical protein n=1 Tax=Siphonobacter sp. SORGH_AS_0500 TaxID=1864824 RepID=UPI001E3C7797|nr:hypothetical protein [Siphonobacter sp. SORGH_AS_0500]